MNRDYQALQYPILGRRDLEVPGLWIFFSRRVRQIDVPFSPHHHRSDLRIKTAVYEV
jgi:hypothetical protein